MIAGDVHSAPMTLDRGFEARSAPGWQWFPWVAMFVIGGSFYLTEHDWTTSLKSSFTQTAEEMQAAAGGGDVVRRLSYPLIGLFGLALLLIAPRTETRWDPLLAGPLLAFVLWCGASALWSTDPGMTVRRLVILYCLVLGAFGIARHATTRGLLLMGVVVPTILLTIGLLAELRLGTFRPWDPEHRFSGTVHPNSQGVNLACLCLSAACLLQNARRWRGVLVALFLYGFVFLLLTKSRTSAAGVLVALGAYWTVTTPLRTKLLLGLAGTWCVASLVLVVLMVGVDVEEQVAGAALMGREEQAESLTGRLPIWTKLAPFVAARPIAGYGYDSFWTPDHIEEVSSELEWGIREAHSTFIDAILAVGFVGLGLGLTMVLMGMLRCQQRYAISGDPIHGLLLAMFVFGLINALTESAMLMPGYYTFLLGTGLCYMATRPAVAGDRDADAPGSHRRSETTATTRSPGPAWADSHHSLEWSTAARDEQAMNTPPSPGSTSRHAASPPYGNPML